MVNANERRDSGALELLQQAQEIVDRITPEVFPSRSAARQWFDDFLLIGLRALKERWPVLPADSRSCAENAPKTGLNNIR